jgi:hypothetical protein
MNNQHSYSHGLLYSVAPDNLTALHLNDEEGKDAFNWKAYETEQNGETIIQSGLSFLKTTAVMWGLIKL